MLYKPVFVGDFEYDFKWLDLEKTHTEVSTVFFTKNKKYKNTVMIRIKAPGVIKISENVKNVIIEGFLDSNTLDIPVSTKALKISSQTVTNFNLTIPNTVLELDIFSKAKIHKYLDISKLKNLKSFRLSYAPDLKSIRRLPENLEYLTLNEVGLKSFPKKLPISLREIYISFFKNVIDFPDLSYLKNLKFIGLDHSAVSKFSKTPPLPKAYLYFVSIPTGSAKLPDHYRARSPSLSIFTEDPYHHIVDGKVVFKKT